MAGYIPSPHRYVTPMLDPVLMLESGITCRNSELLYGGMKLYRSRAINGTRRKARVPLARGLHAIGILDEEEVLRSNHIFVQYRDPKTGNIIPVSGPVVVGRSRCLHPGDSQVVHAIYSDETETPSRYWGTSIRWKSTTAEFALQR